MPLEIDTNGKSRYEHTYNYGQPVDIYGLGLIMHYLTTSGVMLRSQHQLARLILNSGEPVPDAHCRWGKIGGISVEELEKMNSALEAMFLNRAAETDSPRPSSPDRRRKITELVKITSELICSMLSVSAPARPDVTEVLSTLRRISSLVESVGIEMYFFWVRGDNKIC